MNFLGIIAKGVVALAAFVAIFVGMGQIFPQNEVPIALPEAPGEYSVETYSTMTAPEAIAQSSKVGDKVSILPFPNPNKKLPLIVLGKKNTLSFREVVTSKSVSKLQRKLLNMSYRLPRNATIYLVLDSPGGSIDAGNVFIDTAKAIPQKVKTITLFSASMAYHMVQNLDERIITPSGTLMSHRARLGGMGGEIGSDGKGEYLTRTNWILRQLKIMDSKVAKRLKMPLKKYQDLIRDEYWVDGSDAVVEKSADRVALVRCGKDLKGTEIVTISSFFGSIDAHFSKCPLISYPVKIGKARFLTNDSTKRDRLLKYVDSLFNHKRRFVKEYILNGSYTEVQK